MAELGTENSPDLPESHSLGQPPCRDGEQGWCPCTVQDPEGDPSPSPCYDGDRRTAAPCSLTVVPAGMAGFVLPARLLHPPLSGLSECGYKASCQTWGLFHRLNFIPVVPPGFLHQPKQPAASCCAGDSCLLRSGEALAILAEPRTSVKL